MPSCYRSCNPCSPLCSLQLLLEHSKDGAPCHLLRKKGERDSFALSVLVGGTTVRVVAGRPHSVGTWWQRLHGRTLRCLPTCPRWWLEGLVYDSDQIVPPPHKHTHRHAHPNSYHSPSFSPYFAPPLSPNSPFFCSLPAPLLLILAYGNRIVTTMGLALRSRNTIFCGARPMIPRTGN